MSWKRGAYPEFTLEDAVAVLFMLQNPTGRKAISEVLDLGEGSVRTLLKKLAALEVISSTQRGHSLNERGIELLEEISKHFSEVHRIGEVEGYPACALTVKGAGEFKSIELRDEAIRFFAKGAMILVVRDGEPVFPEDGRPLSETMPELAGKIKEAFKLNDGDLVVVTWAEKEADAMKSAYHVALTLKGDELPEEIKSLVR
jgi:predicted transcriptional regulator